MDTTICINTAEIPPETASQLARACKRMYLDIIAMPDGQVKLDAAWEAYQQRKKGGCPNG